MTGFFIQMSGFQTKALAKKLGFLLESMALLHLFQDY